MLQKGCASWGILETIYTVVDECIEFGIHGAFNRVIRSLLESSTAKVDNVISNFTRMSKLENTSHKTTINKMIAIHVPDIMFPDKQDTSLDRSGECKPHRNCPKRSKAVSQRDSCHGQTNENELVTGVTGLATLNKWFRTGSVPPGGLQG